MEDHNNILVEIVREAVNIINKSTQYKVKHVDFNSASIIKIKVINYNGKKWSKKYNKLIAVRKNGLEIAIGGSWICLANPNVDPVTYIVNGICC